jgi:hypothetical protein
MLEHCTIGDCNEALAGDLLEGYSSGLSDGWYWRQVFAACAVSWSEVLRVRASLLIYTLIWSILAPAWKVFIDGIESAPISARILQPLGGFWILGAFAGWLILNSTFIWGGILIYILTLSSCGRVFHGKKIIQAFLLAPLVFAPVYGAWFALCMLDWTMPFEHQALASTPLGQIADLRMLADVMRFPYFITLACVLWHVIPQSKHTYKLLPAEAESIESTTEVDAPELVATADSSTIRQFFFLMVGAGLIEILLCRLILPELHFLTFPILFIRTILYVVIGVLAGVGGSWLYWKNPSSLFREHPPIPFQLFALACASGWIWIPSIAVFSEQLSPATAIVAAISAAFLAAGLRIATSSVFKAEASDSAIYSSESRELFAESLYRAPWEAHGYVITFLLYAGTCALAIRLNFAAAALFALSSFLFVWKQVFVPTHDFDINHEYRRAALRLACVAIPAVLLTAWAMLDEVAHSHSMAENNAASSISNGKSDNGNERQKTTNLVISSGISGYESLILWPVPEKKQIVSPLRAVSLLAPGTTQPLIIPFNGQYWFTQSPNKIPGPTAHHADGTPLDHEIASSNSEPLLVDAHQYLGASIPVVRCREIQVEIENRDNRKGVVSLAVLLTNGAYSKKPTLYIGQQPIVSTKPENFSFKSGAIFETLRFSVPESVKMRSFDEITVMMLPDVEHALIGPRIAIKQFRLLPR